MNGRSSAEGLLLIDKPSGMTSHDAIDAVRQALSTKRVGHAGTLDPMATGLLLVGVGRATRLLRFLGALPKTYEGTICLGVETNTLDAAGEVTRVAPVAVGEPDVRNAAASLVGELTQQPPAFSAVKVGGIRLYEAAREGRELRVEPRRIRVDSFDIERFDGRDADFHLTCGSGTYVRVLAADIGAALGCGAHLSRLRRTRIGSFDVRDASSPESPGAPQSLERAVAHLPAIKVGPDESVAAGHGRPLGPAGFIGPYGVFAPDGHLVGIYEDDGAKARPRVIIAPAGP